MNIKYINIPSKILFDYEIPALAKIIYGQIIILCHKKGYCEVSNIFFSKHNNCSICTIGRMLKILKENKYIKIDYLEKRKIYIANQI